MASGKIDLDASNCLHFTGLQFHELIGLTGIYGITRDKLEKCNVHIYSYQPKQVCIDIRHDGIRLYRLIDLINRRVTNRVFENYKCQMKGIGCSVIASQISEARKLSFKKIVVSANRYAYSEDPTDSHKGYIVWGKLGFQMSKDASREFLNEIATTKFKNVSNLFDLLHHENGGEEFWLKEGYKWEGHFDLNLDSDSEIAFHYYKSNRYFLMKRGSALID